jgi:DNA replication protein DnaC
MTFLQEAEEWYRRNMEFVNAMPESKFKEGMKAAALRNKARIAEIGYATFKARADADKERMLRDAAKADTVAQTKAILENSGLGKRFFVRTFDTFKVNKHNERAWQACYDIASGKRKKGVLLNGGRGIGKTHLAAAVINHLADKGHKVYFGNIVKIIKKVQDSFNTGTELVIKKMLDCDYLVIDDLGAEAVKNEGWLKSLLYEILNTAYEDDKTVIITTNIDNLSMTDRYGDTITSRISEMCEWIEYHDADHRREFEPIDDGEPTPFDTN